MGQLGHTRPIDHAGNGLDLLGLLRQLWMLLKLLGKVTRIGMTEPTRERIGNQLGFLERYLAIRGQSQLLDKLAAFLSRRLFHLGNNFGAARRQAGNLDNIAFVTLPLLGFPLLS